MSNINDKLAQLRGLLADLDELEPKVLRDMISRFVHKDCLILDMAHLDHQDGPYTFRWANGDLESMRVPFGQDGLPEPVTYLLRRHEHPDDDYFHPWETISPRVPGALPVRAGPERVTFYRVFLEHPEHPGQAMVQYWERGL